MTIVTLFLSLAVVIIAALQWRIADNKLRLDLFDRRYKVYDATRKFLAVIIRDAAFTQSQLVEFSIGTSVELNSPQTITPMTDIRSTMAAKAVLAIGMMTALLLTGCGKKHPPQYVHIAMFRV